MYELYEEERKSNINRCILKRHELISNTKKVKPTLKKIKNDEESEDEDFNFISSYKQFELSQNYKLRKSEDNYINFLRKNKSAKKQKFVPEHKIIETKNKYIMNSSNGKKSEITKQDLEKITCLKDEKDRLGKKTDKKDNQLMRYLKVELDRAKKIKKVKDKLNEKDQKIQNFITIKNTARKQLENGRYQDYQDIHERQLIYEKLLSNYDQKIYYTKQQQKEQNKTINSNKISVETSNKMEKLSKQIKDYEKKNDEYKQKITNLFDLKEKKEMDKKIKERINKKEKNNIPLKKENSTSLIKKKLNDLEEKFEIEKYRRENALMVSMTKFQNKINSFLEKSEKKENKIKNAIFKAEKKKEEKKLKRINHLNEVKENIKKNEKLNEEKRQKLLDDIEKKNLKDYAIKQEKNKMLEQKRKMNKLNQKERQELKLKIEQIIQNENNIDECKNSEEIINKLLNEKNNKS